MSKTLNILNCQGENVGEYVVPDTAIELEKGAAAVHEAVVAILAGQRADQRDEKQPGCLQKPDIQLGEYDGKLFRKTHENLLSEK